MRLKWNDCRLSWDPASYNNLTDITVQYRNVWFPDITLYDSASDDVMFPERDAYGAYIYNTGIVSYNFPSVITSVCRVNVRYFPFDTQRCPLKLGSWSHHGLNVDLVSKNPYGDVTAYIENTEWRLSEFPTERTVVYYNCCPEPYPDITYYIVLQRLPSFYVLTMIFPCILVTFVSALTFILPTESGEKISLEITVLLSLAVFLLVVSESLPPASDNFPIIGSYFAASMVMVSMSLLLTVLVLNVFHRGTNGRTVPKWINIVCFRFIGPIVRVKTGGLENKVHAQRDQDTPGDNSSTDTNTYVEVPSNSTSETNLEGTRTNDETSDNTYKDPKQPRDVSKTSRFVPKFIQTPHEEPTIKLMQEQTQKLSYIVRRLEKRNQEDTINSEWRDVANVLDRLFLILYCLITFIVTLAFLMQNVNS